MAGQTTWNKAEAPAGTEPWGYVTQVKRALDTAGLVFDVASLTERNGLAALAPGGVLPVPTMIFRTDLQRYESWNGTRWAQPGLTELGRSTTGLGGTVAQTPSWSDILIVNGTSLGGEVTVDYRLTLTNVAASGAHRDTAVRVTCDGTEIDGWDFKAPWVSGIDAPVFPSLQVIHTPAAGAHTWKIQGNAIISAAIQVRKGSVTVTEKP